MPKLEDFVDRVLTYSENNDTPSSVFSKKHTLKNHVVPLFGAKRLDQLGPAEVEAFKAAMRAKESASRARKENPTIYAVGKRKEAPARHASMDMTLNVATGVPQVVPHPPSSSCGSSSHAEMGAHVVRSSVPIVLQVAS